MAVNLRTIETSGDLGLASFGEEVSSISLTDVLATDVHLACDDAVSIIELLCEVLLRAAVEQPVPPPTNIFITSDGDVRIQAVPGRLDPTEAARRLHDLLATATVPVPLRLFLSQAISTSPYASLAAFAEALAFYGKEGRGDRVKAVFERCTAKGTTPAASPVPAAAGLVPTVARPVPAVVSPVPAVAAPPPAPAADVSRSKRRMPIWLPVGVAAVFAVSTAMLVWSRLTPVSRTETRGEVLGPAPETPSAPSIQEPTPTPQIPPTLPSFAPQPSTSPSGSPGRTTPDVRAIQAPIQAIDVFLPTSPVTPAIEPGPERAPTTAGTEVGAVPVAPREASDPVAVPAPLVAEIDARIYTNGDAGVVPARLVKPQLLPPPLAGGQEATFNQLELIISRTGSVEQVRFTGGPRRMADMMILSSAKMWEFTPASKDGRPVRYRAILTWEAGP